MVKVERPKHDINLVGEDGNVIQTLKGFNKGRSKWLKRGFLSLTLGLEDKKTSINDVEGWIFPGDLEALWSLSRCVQEGGSYLEIGSFKGLSTSIVYSSLVDMGLNTFTIDAVDSFRFITSESFKHSSRVAGFDKVLTTHEEDSHSYLRKADKSKTFDFIFIDASHEYEDVKKDIELSLELLTPGAIISGHDYLPEVFPGVVRAVKEVFGERNLEFKVFKKSSVWFYKVPNIW